MSTYQAGEAFPTPCPECRGKRIAAVTYEGSLGRQSAGGGGIRFLSSMFAVVCIQCGHTALFARDLAKVRQALERNSADFQYMAEALQQQLKTS